MVADVRNSLEILCVEETSGVYILQNIMSRGGGNDPREKNENWEKRKKKGKGGKKKEKWRKEKEGEW